MKNKTSELLIGLGAIALGAAAAALISRLQEETEEEVASRERFANLGTDRQAGFVKAMAEIALAIKVEYDWLDDPSDSDTSELVTSEVLTRLLFRFELMQELGRANRLEVFNTWQEYLPPPAA